MHGGEAGGWSGRYSCSVMTRFGLSISAMIQEPRDGDLARRLQDILGWVRRARDLGFDYIVTGQHFLVPEYQTLQPLPLLGRIAAESGEMRLVPTLLLPLLQPVDVAEATATLDVITNGRLTLNFARGYRDEEFTAFGVDKQTASKRMKESLDRILATWSGAGTRPLQRPHPPVWIAADGDAGVRRAARWGFPWCVSTHPDITTLERQLRLYRSEAADAGVALPIGRELYCAPTRQQALADAERYLGGKYLVYAAWGQDKELPGRPSFEQSFEALARDRFIVGSPDDCARELRRYLELGATDIHLRMAWSGMPVELAQRSLELFATEVRPSLPTG